MAGVARAALAYSRSCRQRQHVVREWGEAEHDVGGDLCTLAAKYGVLHNVYNTNAAMNLEDVTEALLGACAQQEVGSQDVVALLRVLRLLVPEKHLQRALELVEQGQVTELVGEASGRRLFQASRNTLGNVLSFLHLSTLAVCLNKYKLEYCSYFFLFFYFLFF